MGAKRLSDEQKTQANRILDEFAAEHNTTAEKLCVKAYFADLMELRKQLYKRLREEMRLTYSKIGEVCNRSEDAVGDAFKTEDSLRRRRCNRYPKPKLEPAKPPVVLKPEPDPSARNGVTRAGAAGNQNGGIHVRLVTTWLTKEDDTRLRKLLAKHNCRQEDMVRGIIIDALHDDEVGA